MRFLPNGHGLIEMLVNSIVNVTNDEITAVFDYLEKRPGACYISDATAQNTGYGAIGVVMQ